MFGLNFPRGAVKHWREVREMPVVTIALPHLTYPSILSSLFMLLFSFKFLFLTLHPPPSPPNTHTHHHPLSWGRVHSVFQNVSGVKREGDKGGGYVLALCFGDEVAELAGVLSLVLACS